MKCVLCEEYGVGITNEKNNTLCFKCISEIKNLTQYAPNPFQECEMYECYDLRHGKSRYCVHHQPIRVGAER
jgi:hypothetical protein